MTNKLDTKEFLEGKEPEDFRRGCFHKLKPGEARYAGHVPSYYRDEYARALLPTLLDMEDKKVDKEFFPVGKEKVTTLYQRIQQSFMYAIDHLDAAEILEDLRNSVMLRKTPRGVVLCYKTNASKYTQEARASKLPPRFDAFKSVDIREIDWRESLDKFMNSDDQKELLLTAGFFLSADDMNTVKMLVDMVPDQFELVEINQYKIHIRRLL